jgi:linoleoyl-CoA desaturase
MWNIYGKQYDLTKFIDKHPGGKFILERTKNLEDITALFETYHAFSNIEKIQETLNKYEIKQQEKDNNHLIEYNIDFTNYRKLVKKVNEIFPNINSIKANTQWVINNLTIFSIAAFTFYISYISKSPFYYKIISQFIYSIFEVSISFNILHDGSHYGISRYPKINLFLSKLANDLYIWNLNIWFFHHVYYHHSFTGLENDPDDKVYKLNFSKYIYNKISKSNIDTFIYFCVLPGQQLGQSLLYLFVQLSEGKYSEKIIFPKICYYDFFDIIFISLKIYLMYCAGIIQFFIHFFTINTLYYINVYPNHSFYETKIENIYNGNDWAKMQICNSGNFLMSNLWWTRIFGGINYQIEHHLFPNMSNIHYPKVSKIVQEYCKENNIPYVNKNTLYEAYNSFIKYLDH